MQTVLKPAPFFAGKAVENKEMKDLKLSDLFGKYVVLLFYPMDFTFVCPTEIIAFSDRITEFKKLKNFVVGISTDSPFTHLAWVYSSQYF
jgi:alkyl hydroperoxide reductase subunit AhpC